MESRGNEAEYSPVGSLLILACRLQALLRDQAPFTLPSPTSAVQ